MKLLTLLNQLLPKFREYKILEKLEEIFPLEARLCTSGFEVWRLDPALAQEWYHVTPDKVRVEFVKVASFGEPHIHKSAKASFLFLGEKSGFPNPQGATLLLGEYDEVGTSLLQRHSIYEGLTTTVLPMVVHGFEATGEHPIFFLAAHTPLIHENGDMFDIDCQILESQPKLLRSELD